MSRLSVSVDPYHAAGHALIRISGAAAEKRPITFQIHREGWQECNVGPRGWQVAEAALTPASVATEGNDLLLGVGPAICDLLETGVYKLAIPTLGIEENVIWPDIVPLHGGHSGVFHARPAIVAQTTIDDTIVVNPPPKPAPDPVTSPPVTNQTGGRVSKFPWVGAASVGGLVVAAAIVAFVFYPPHGTAPPPPPPVTPPQQPVMNLDSMSVQDLIARNNPAEIFDQARKRLAARPQEAMLLLESAGDDRHFGPALTLMAQLYDPNKPRQGGIPADPRQAAHYYRDAAAQGDQSGAADREALHHTIAQAKDSGDLRSKLIDQEFWP